MGTATTPLNQCYNIFLEPFRQGALNLKDCWKGKRVTSIAAPAIHIAGKAAKPKEIKLTLSERVSAAAIGIVLLIPLINALVFAILKVRESSFVHPIKGAAKKLDDPEPLSLAPPVMPRATPQEYLRRKNEANALLPLYPAAGRVHFECNPDLLRYNLDAVLQRYNGRHSPSLLSGFFDYAEIPLGSRFLLNLCFDAYPRGSPSDNHRVVRELLSKLHDCLSQKKALFQGTPHEDTLKEEIRDVFNRILDAHRNCVDQVTGQMESIVTEVIAEFESSRSRGAQTMEGRLLHRAAYALFKYRTNLIKAICVREYPTERHQADLERLVKQNLARMMGCEGAVFDVGAAFNVVSNSQVKIERIRDIFLGATDSPDQEEYRYDAEKFLFDNLKTYHGIARPLRNDLLIWAKNHFDVEANNPQTTRFTRLLSENPDENDVFVDGGNLTNAGLLFLLEKTGIFVNRRPFSLPS